MKTTHQSQKHMARYLTLLFFFSIYFSIYSQKPKTYVNFPSPNASNLGMYGDIPVGHFTGTPTINIPLYNLSAKGIQIPISLSYHSASIKVNNHPGWVGLGWTLQAGGVITRVQNGFMDEHQKKDVADIGFFANYNKLNANDWSTDAKLWQFGEDYTDPTSAQSEAMPDEFNFNFMGYNGSFYLDHTGNWVVVSDQKIKVDFNSSTGFINSDQLPARIKNKMPNVANNLCYRHFNEFTLITPDGTRYTFGGDNAVEYSMSYRQQPLSYATSTSWYLKKITSSTGNVINFNYAEGNLVCALGVSKSYFNISLNGNGFIDPSCVRTSDDRYNVNEAQGHLIFPVYLASVKSSYGNIYFEKSQSQELRYEEKYLEFDYDHINDMVYFNHWNELQWSKLDRIIIKSGQDVPLKKFEFTYNNNSAQRLRLLSVQEIGLTDAGTASTSKPAHTFEYNSTFLPPYLSDKTDHWGFNNGGFYGAPGDYSGTIEEWVESYYGTREPYIFETANGWTDYPKAEMLEKITYPTGGYTTFDWEYNTYSQVVSENRTSLEQIEAKLCNLTRPPCEVFPIIGGQFQVQSGVPINYYLHIHKCFNQTYPVGASAPYVRLKLKNVTTNTFISTYDFNIYQEDYEISGNISAIFPGIVFNSAHTYQVISEEAGNIPTTYRPYIEFSMSHPSGGEKKTGGLRIKKISSYHSASQDPLIKEYEYSKTFNTSTIGSSGILGGKVDYWWPNFKGKNIAGDIYTYDLFSSNSLLPFGHSGQGSHIGYSEVTEIQKDVNGNTLGKTKFTFTNFDQDIWGNTHMDEAAINWIDEDRSAYAPFTSTDFERGKNTSTEIYNTSNQLLKKTTQQYARSSGNYVRMVLTEHFDICSNVSAVGQTWFGTAYKKYTCSYNPVKKEEIEYLGGTPLSKVQNFEYVADNLLSLNKITNSDGAEHITKYKYPIDYSTAITVHSAALAIKKMKELNIHQPIERMNYIKRAGGVEELIDAQLSVYQIINNIPLLKEEWNTELNTPQTGFVSSIINASGDFIKSNLYKTHNDVNLPMEVINSYDSRGNIFDYYSQNHNKNSFVWSKNPDLAVASIKNAGKADIAYHGFDGIEIADYGWTIPATTNLSTTSKIGKSAVVSSATYPKVIITPEGQFKKFMLSVWVRATATTAGKLVLRVMNGNTEVKKIEQALTITTPNSFVKQTLQADLSKIRTDVGIPATNTSLKIEAYVQWTSGTFYIDEFRLHPTDAYMTSYVYDAKLNVIAISNEREEISSYFYDDLNRLRYVKDFEDNVRSVNDYHYSTGANDQNYVKTTTLLVPGKTSIITAISATQSEKQEVFNYLDGLGRGIQTNQVNAGPAGHDIVSFTEYDAFGRVVKNYLPVPLDINTTIPGAYRTTIKTDQAAKYNTAGYIEGVEVTTFPFSESKFDNSPLNRLVEKGYAGATWQLTAIGKTRKMVYRTNTSDDAVRNFSSAGISTSTYAAGDLFVEEITNTDGEKSAVFKDKLGRVILTRQYGTTAANNKNTYTIYNLLGQVIYVIPQIGVKWMQDNNNWNSSGSGLNQLIYKYTYDARGRMLTKKVPNKIEEKYFYDKRDRQILVKNGRDGVGTGAPKEYTFIKYDIQDRIVQTGLYYASADPTQTTINAKPLNETPSNAANGYTNVAFPDVTSSGSKVLTINYYDHYDIDLNGTANYTYTSDAAITETVDASFANTRGLRTASKVAVINNPKPDDATWISTATFYNKYARAIQIQKTNLFASGSDVEKNQYNNFRGLLIKHKTTHTGVGSGLNVLETYEYTKSGLLTKTKQKVNNQTEIVLSNNKYNKLGTPITKQIHSINTGTSYLQDIDYKYNIRGWLTDINDVGDNCGVNGSTTCNKDVFALKLFYNTIDDKFVNADNTPLYDGGISAARWKTAGMSLKDTVMYGYNYIYDEFNQLKDANFFMTNRKKDPANLYTWLNDFEVGKYNEHMTYDAMGNILSLNRTGKKIVQGALIDENNFDQLTYSYKGNQLVTVNDAKQTTAGQTGFGFIDGVKLTSSAGNTTNDEYIYDNRGNVITDKNKTISTITYNHLDLPIKVTFSNNRTIEFVYTATGQKIRKIQKTGSTINAITEYTGQTQYAGTSYANRAFTGFYHAEGKLIKDGTDFVNQYAIKDHLGNVRVRIQDKKVNGVYDGILDKTKEILEETHYYPFGMAFTSNTNPATPAVDNFKYNNKELNTDFGLNWYDYQARQYDATLGRWNSVDPLADKYASWSPYNYVFNNPISFIDPDGMEPDCPNCTTSTVSARNRADKKIDVKEVVKPPVKITPKKSTDQLGNTVVRTTTVNTTITTQAIVDPETGEVTNSDIAIETNTTETLIVTNRKGEILQNESFSTTSTAIFAGNSKRIQAFANYYNKGKQWDRTLRNTVSNTAAALANEGHKTPLNVLTNPEAHKQLNDWLTSPTPTRTINYKSNWDGTDVRKGLTAQEAWGND